MTFKIDLQQLDELKTSHVNVYEALERFLTDVNSPSVLYGNEGVQTGAYSPKLYTYRYKQISYSFHFKQTILRNERASGKSGFRYDYFEKANSPYRAGGFGAVYPIMGTITFTQDHFVHKRSLNKVVKHEHFQKANRKNAIIQEYKGLVQAGHLKVKPPLFNQNLDECNSFLIMEKAEGQTLESLLHPDKCSKLLSLQQRIELTIAILQAIQSQIVERKLIHRDIKPGNIIVNFAFSPPKVTIIDFGFIIEEGKQDKLRCGTRAYRSPESFEKNPIYSTKSDSWSAGRVLSYLWGDVYENYYMAKNKDRNYLLSIVKNAQLFSEPELELYLSEEDKGQIKTIIELMTTVSTDKRISIADALKSFQTIDFAKYLNTSLEETVNLTRFNVQVSLIEQKLLCLRVQSESLRNRHYPFEAAKMSRLEQRVSAYTDLLKKNPTPFLIEQYKSICSKEIEHSKSQLSHHRDLNWLLGEISIAIVLLGFGYVIALGVNYYSTGRLGLFSQTNSEKLLSNADETILQLMI
ncbi:Dot/Icm T4SS effector kinase LegK1 [Legionella waltersii]|uniref:Serine/threonine-protein kinase n=1 Tax=Legionella waltersii TaxID=66969 RepID=A0A0W1A1C8_9GAMM|nr:Dot/Icm T4SS effector kinase LegK1 [Legionella waltersii]KTD75112.1 serine/threonine-protein kinase [Legionella waltersii]SNV05030.1 serine/threonine-protein kinase [Legionella waltersii]